MHGGNVWSSQRERLLQSAGSLSDSIEDIILKHSNAHGLPLQIIGIVGGGSGGTLGAKSLLDQLCLRDSRGGENSAEGESPSLLSRLGNVELVYRDQENVLYLCLESVASASSTLWTALASSGDAAFVAGVSAAELSQIVDLVMLFSLCNLILWMCPGSAPRVDQEALQMLGKLHELAVHPLLAPVVAERTALSTQSEPDSSPVLLFVYLDIRFPKLGDRSGRRSSQRHLVESAEKALDSKWKACIKRQLQEAQMRSKLFRLHRPCALVVPGPFPTHSLKDLDTVVYPNTSDGEDQLSTLCNLLWPMDGFREHVAQMIQRFRSERRESAPSLETWLESARDVRRGVRQLLEPPDLLPPQLAAMASVASATNGAKPADPEDGGSKERGKLKMSLCWWAFAELLFSFGSLQKGVDEGFKAYRSGVPKHGSISAEVHEQQLRVGLQTLRPDSFAPLDEAATEALAQRCKDHSGPRLLSAARGPLKWTVKQACLCGKSLVNKKDSEAPKSLEASLLPGAACCRDARFLPFLPLNADFVADPVLVPTSPRLAKSRSGQNVSVLPSALPDACGFVALVADPPVKLDPTKGSRLPGFGDSYQQMDRWRLPSADVLSLNSSPPRYAYVAFEYMDPQGNRFFLPPSKNSGLVLNSTAVARATRREKRRRERAPHGAGEPSGAAHERPPALPGLLDEGEYEVAPLCSYRLFVPSPAKHGRKEGSSKGNTDPSCVAQISRIWIQTPPATKSGELIEAAPRVCIADSRQGRGADGRFPEVTCGGGKVALPHDSLVQLVLPTTYWQKEDDGSLAALPGFWDMSRSDADRCRLLPYLFWVSKPS